jgi:hypothetical protein
MGAYKDIQTAGSQMMAVNNDDTLLYDERVLITSSNPSLFEPQPNKLLDA